MPAQPGVFNVPYASGHSTHKTRAGQISENANANAPYSQNALAGPSRSHGPPEDKREKRRDKREMGERQHETRQFTDAISGLHANLVQLSTHPEMSASYRARLYPLTLERSAYLAQVDLEERQALHCAAVAYEEERSRVEEEWQKGRAKVRERLMEGIEERRKRAREDKDSEGTVNDAALDSQSRSHITRKLRNKLASPSPVPISLPALGAPTSSAGGTPGALISNVPVTTGPFHNPNSLSVDEIPSPFPLALTTSNGGGGSGPGSNGANGTSSTAGGGGPGTGRRRPKGSGTNQSQAIGGLGKSLILLAGCKEAEADSDLGEIRRGNRRRRAAASSLGKAVA